MKEPEGAHWPLTARLVRSVCLAPQGGRLAYAVVSASPLSDVYLSRVQVRGDDGSEETWLEVVGVAHGLAWSADGRRLALAVAGELWVAEGPGQATCWLAAEEGRSLGRPHWLGAAEELVVVRRGRSMEGRRPLAVTALPYKADGQGYRAEPNVLLRVAEGGHELLPARSPRGPMDVRPSPDGRYLAIAEPAPQGIGFGEARVRVVETDRWAEEGLPVAFPPRVGPMAWSPDGRYLAALAAEGTYGDARPLRLWVAEPGGPAQVWDPQGDRHLGGAEGAADWDWAGDGLGLFWEGPDAILAPEARHGDVHLVRLHPDRPPERVTAGAGCVAEFFWQESRRRLVGVWHDPQRLSELVEWTLGEAPAPPRRLSNWNPQVWRTPEERWIRGAEGDRIQTWFLPPEGATGPGPAPAVFLIHGGPHGAFGRSVMLVAQALAREGIAVAYANPHGSSGYGHRFAAAVTGDWGGVDGRDWEAFRDLLVAEGRIDPRRLGVMGTSYGGFMAAWLASRWPEVRAAVIQAPVMNQLSMLYASDLGYGFMAHEAGLADLDLTEEEVRRLWRRSPLARAAAIRAKVLLLVGERDDRCPMAEAEQLYVALRRRGHPVELVIYPGEHHLLTSHGRPRTRLDRLRRVLSFFFRELIGGPSDPPDREAPGTAAAGGMS